MFVYRITDEFTRDRGYECYYNIDAPILTSNEEWSYEDFKKLVQELCFDEEYEEERSIGEITDLLVEKYGFNYLKLQCDVTVNYEER